MTVREGFESIEHVKRYTALGFGTDQGKTANVNGLAIVANALGREIPEVGTTVFRPNYTPVSFGVVAGASVGELFDPERHTPMHAWHVAAGAAFENVGQWRRPWYYPREGESMADAIAREQLATRDGVGILDASTLGKIDIQGPDAREAPQPRLHERVDEARPRALPLRAHVHRGRHGVRRRRDRLPRRRALPHDDDDRGRRPQCSAGSSSGSRPSGRSSTCA